MDPGDNAAERSLSIPIGGEFGTSVQMNTIRDVIDFHEKRIKCTHGYPRIVPHTVVTSRESEAAARSGLKYAVAFPVVSQAEFMIGDLSLRTGGAPPYFESPGISALLDLVHGTKTGSSDHGAIKLTTSGNLTFACTDNQELSEKLRYIRRVWGSAFDVHGLAGKAVPRPVGYSRQGLLDSISQLEGGPSGSTLDFQSGMAAVSSIFLAMLGQGRRIILIGPSYVDTGVMVTQWPSEAHGLKAAWLPSAETLEDELKKGPAFVFFEAPTNPCLTLPDISAILDSASRHKAVTGVDATLATPYNFRPLKRGFDISMHSTSKFLSGGYRHLGGVVTAGDRSILKLISIVRDELDLGMCENQSHILFEGVHGFKPRMERINDNAAEIVERLLGSPVIGNVMYPGLGSGEQRRICSDYLSPGRSGVLSFVLKDESMEAFADFHDNIRPPVMKGPGLGGEISLMCPYSLVAHYKADPGFLAARGMHPHLLRLSVGVEDPDEIWNAMRLDR
jgi:cystathionine beta-lyase/cystathionine gamma-synthase